MNLPIRNSNASLAASRAGIQSVEVGFALLDALAGTDRPLMLRDLANAAAMSAAKAHRYLVSFQRLGLVVQDAATTRYALGPAALKIGLAALASLDAVQLARTRAGPLMEEIGHTVALAVWGNRGPTIVHWEESPQSVTVNLRLGDVMPLLASATGRCFAAYISTSRAADAIAPMLQQEMALAARQGRTDLPRSMADVKELMTLTRKQGLAQAVDCLLPGVTGLCAPVFDSDSHLVLGIITMGSSNVIDGSVDGPVAKALMAAARRLSSDLGYAGDFQPTAWGIARQA